VRFDETGIVPENGRYLTDDSIETCTSFLLDEGRPIPQYTMFRIEVVDDDADLVNVTIIGTNLSCGYNLHVTPLSSADTEKWTGRWTKCPLKHAFAYGNKEKCFYQCQCSGGCEEIQVIKRPRTVEESEWTVCSICVVYNLAGMLISNQLCSIFSLSILCHSQIKLVQF